MTTHYCTSSPCPLCHPVYTIPYFPLGHAVSVGCVCPPTSERTCQSQTCPRKPWKATASGMVAGTAETHASASCTVANCFLCNSEAGGSGSADQPDPKGDAQKGAA